MKSTFAPALRAAGLKGSSGRFELPSETYWAQLGFQKSAFSSADSLKFTVNLSVIAKAEWAERSSGKPTWGTKPRWNTIYGPWAEQVRIGRVTPNNDDLWWWLHRDKDPNPVAAEVVTTLQRFAVPWLKRMSSG